jgi:ABC-type xylose transport system permease subunit
VRSSSALKRWRVRSRTDTQRMLTTLLILAVLFAVAALLSKGVFLKPSNLLNLVFQNVILGVVALGHVDARALVAESVPECRIDEAGSW